MKQQQITNTDWQLLSEYLDGQISARDKATLEKRMQTQEELRAGLDELRQTRALLRTVTKQRVPRNFTLTPAMVEQVRPRPWLRWIPVLNFASAAAALAVAVMMLVNFLPGATPAAAPAPTAGSEATSLMAAESQPDVQLEPAPLGGTPVIIQWGGGMGGGAGTGGAVENMPTNMLSIPEADVARDMKAPDASSPASASPQIASAPLEGSDPILGVVPADEAQAQNQRQIEEAAVPAAQVDAYANQETPPNNWLVPVAVGLGLIALAAGVASYWLRRKAAV